MRLTLGLPGRLEAGQRSNAGLAHANLEVDAADDADVDDDDDDDDDGDDDEA